MLELELELELFRVAAGVMGDAAVYDVSGDPALVDEGSATCISMPHTTLKGRRVQDSFRHGLPSHVNDFVCRALLCN